MSENDATERTILSPIMTSNSFSSLILSDNELIEAEVEIHTEQMETREEAGSSTPRPSKRRVEERNVEEDDADDGEWTTVGGNKQKKCKTDQIIEVYISSDKIMPKQFALAKTFTELGISDIQRVKYINPYKIRADISNDKTVTKLENSKELTKKGWRIQRVLETSYSFGVIKNVDMNLTDEDISKGITSTGDGELVGVYRLKRRNPAGDGWDPSEAVRLCFKGSYLPPFILVEGLRIKVERYVFPVSQCGRCWKLGHSTKKCPTTRITCPKCGENHANCNTESFKCVNCGGPHMALNKSSCPVYKREKRLRELMSEFNCTYRRALTLYVPSTNPAPVKNKVRPHNNTTPRVEEHQTPATVPIDTPNTAQSYAQAAINNQNRKAVTSYTPKPRYQQETDSPRTDVTPMTDTRREEEPQTDSSRPQIKQERDVTFNELLNRLKEIIFLKKATLPVKVQSVIKCCIEWFILLVVENITDWPILKTILDLFSSNG